MEIGAFAIAVAVISGIASFIIGRAFRRKRLEKKTAHDRAVAEAGQSRQVRRARERKAQR